MATFSDFAVRDRPNPAFAKRGERLFLNPRVSPLLREPKLSTHVLEYEVPATIVDPVLANVHNMAYRAANASLDYRGLSDEMATRSRIKPKYQHIPWTLQFHLRCGPLTLSQRQQVARMVNSSYQTRGNRNGTLRQFVKEDTYWFEVQLPPGIGPEINTAIRHKAAIQQIRAELYSGGGVDTSSYVTFSRPLRTLGGPGRQGPENIEPPTFRGGPQDADFCITYSPGGYVECNGNIVPVPDKGFTNQAGLRVEAPCLHDDPHYSTIFLPVRSWSIDHVDNRSYTAVTAMESSSMASAVEYNRHAMIVDLGQGKSELFLRDPQFMYIKYRDDPQFEGVSLHNKANPDAPVENTEPILPQTVRLNPDGSTDRMQTIDPDDDVEHSLVKINQQWDSQNPQRFPHLLPPHPTGRQLTGWGRVGVFDIDYGDPDDARRKDVVHAHARYWLGRFQSILLLYCGPDEPLYLEKLDGTQYDITQMWAAPYRMQPTYQQKTLHARVQDQLGPEGFAELAEGLPTFKVYGLPVGADGREIREAGHLTTSDLWDLAVAGDYHMDEPLTIVYDDFNDDDEPSEDESDDEAEPVARRTRAQLARRPVDAWA